MRVRLLALLLAVAVKGRQLEDEKEWTNYRVQQGACFRVKIQDDNDDDAEGNSYFYNGAYRSQYQRYIAFELCNDDGCSPYVTDLSSFLEGSISYAQTYCSSCSTLCSRRRRDEEQNNDNQVWNVNCNQCASDCTLMNSNGNNGLDEADYIDCQEKANNGGGDIEYYTAPQCENGEVVIGHFYDEECTIKTSTLQDEGFSYNTFRTIEKLQLDCSIADESPCKDIFNNAIYCGDDEADDEDASRLCKAAKSAARVYTYYRKPLYKKVPIIPIVLLIVVLGTGFGLLSYTYYVRHRRHSSIHLDGGNENLPTLT